MTKKPELILAPGRPVKEWVGLYPSSKVPAPIKLRIWRRENGICHISGRKIQSGEDYQLEHKIRLADGGENRESNIFLALTEPHKAKSALEQKRAAKADRVAKKHLGITKPKGNISSRGFEPKEEKPGKIDKNALPKLSRRPLFQ